MTDLESRASLENASKIQEGDDVVLTTNPMSPNVESGGRKNMRRLISYKSDYDNSVMDKNDLKVQAGTQNFSSYNKI